MNKISLDSIEAAASQRPCTNRLTTLLILLQSCFRPNLGDHNG
jgi:hypothetical protein